MSYVSKAGTMLDGMVSDNKRGSLQIHLPLRNSATMKLQQEELAKESHNISSNYCVENITTFFACRHLTVIMDKQHRKATEQVFCVLLMQT